MGNCCIPVADYPGLSFSSSLYRNFWKWLLYCPMWASNQWWWSFGCCWCQSGQFIWGRSWIPWIDFSKVQKTLAQGNNLLNSTVGPTPSEIQRQILGFLPWNTIQSLLSTILGIKTQILSKFYAEKINFPKKSYLKLTIPRHSISKEHTRARRFWQFVEVV